MKFIRHGDPAVFPFWSHHDKHVTIDQEISFLGGIDITFGRFETSDYKLRDDEPDQELQMFPGADYANPRIFDVKNPELPLDNNHLHDRGHVPRMPWRDIHGCVVGTGALDVAWHFIQRWNYTRYINHEKKTHPALLPSGLGNLALSWLDRRKEPRSSTSPPQHNRRTSINIRPISSGDNLRESQDNLWSNNASSSDIGTRDSSGGGEDADADTGKKKYKGRRPSLMGSLVSSSKAIIMEEKKPLYVTPEQNEFTSKKNRKSRVKPSLTTTIPW